MSNINGNPRTRVIDSLAEELDEICNRMKRSNSSQKPTKYETSMSMSTSDFDHSDFDKGNDLLRPKISLMSNDQTRIRQPANMTPARIPRNRVFLDLKSQQQQQQDISTTTTTRSSSSNSGIKVRDPSLTSFSDDLAANDDYSTNTGCSSCYDYLKTPVSPSKAVASFNGFAEGKDHKICFDTDLKNSFCSEKNFLTTKRSQPLATTGCLQKSYMTTDDSSGFSSDCTSSDLTLQPTHRGMHRFVPRHQDELLIEVGDPVFVDYESDDQWCQGMNLRTSLTGIFPNTHVFEVDLDPFEMNNVNCDSLTSEKDTFFVTHLASVEVAHHKGNDVLIQAIHKVIQAFQKREDIVKPAPVLLDISFRGVHVIDKSKKNWFRCPNFDYFYSLQNISFCGAHPKQLKYFGFITKHPLLPRFACHVFMSNASTEPVVESIGRAFQKSYNEYMAFAHPTEDIYME